MPLGHLPTLLQLLGVLPADSHQPRVGDSLRRGGHTPFLGHQVCAMMTDGCRTLQDQL